MTAAVATPASRTDWLAVTVVVASGIVAALQVGKAAIAMPLVRAEFGLDLGTLGWLASIFAVLGMVGGIPVGTLAIALGARRVLLLGLLAVAAGALLGAAVPRFPMLLASRVVEGLGFLLITIAAPAILQRVASPAQRDIVMALWSCFMPTGIALAMLAGLWLSDWRMIWQVTGALAVVAIVLTVLTVPNTSGGTRPSWAALAGDACAVLSARGPVLLGFTFALYALMFFALFNFLPVLLMQRMEVSLATAGLLGALASAVNIIGNLTAGLLLARGASRVGLIVSASLVMGLSAIGIFLGLLPDSATFLLCVLFSMVGGIIPATLLSSAPVLAPAAGLTPVVIGLLMQGSNLGQVVGPVAIGSVIEAFGWPSAAGLVGGAAVIAILTALGLRGAPGRKV
ncbi:Predicted arabinose efflux permease, MFS family [Bosea sp. 62]|uniref:MFS transporter n=1 Tax=unclassified Bosea (in: a-proteobacteria) TaxID=2653178 RepID=UPI00125A1D7C|nr:MULTISPECIES: MFS transporter [unclassified Bosea (in: a-proteobacteria)]CAD5288401.1 Predicted arabinose efflux permease, MFS family [Bosea sp. 21B]CAD5290699.1 Predicted arabinose efflux permease, MFS family [Bosea sp. 46]CAD5300856.1 Predicted arabinose efflux permease, MFS family [Bosea sp. 7B]VVT60356.1 Predicted arabinose efflux permease, MFS family [Bosea sp. EC-HK365B]VXA97112.1 Predicted arabinose efflux permease, MFS family [Bosea sp. 62]